MRTRTRTDSPVGQRLDLSWDTPSEETPPVENATAEKLQSQLEPSTLPSEPVSPAPTLETSPASSNTNGSPRQEPAPAAVRNASDTSPVEADKQETPKVASPVKAETLVPNAEETPPSTENASKPASPATPSQTDEQPISPSSATEAPKVTSSMEAPEEPAKSQEASQNDAPGTHVEHPISSPKPPRKPAPPVNIIPNEEPVGVILARKREEANVKVEDLAKRLNISAFVIRYLEGGDYEGLSRTFGENNCVYIIFNFKSIGEELGMSKNEIDDLVEKLNKEIATAGLKLDAPVKHDDDAKNLNTTVRRRPVKSVLPKLIVVTLVIVCILIFFLAVVVPYVSRIRTTGPEKRVDFLPLIEQPWNNMRTIPPQQLPIP